MNRGITSGRASGRRLADLRGLAQALDRPEPGAEEVALIAALCARIEAAPGAPDPAEARLAAEIRAAAQRNLRRLEARLAGLRAAQALLAAARGAEGHTIYGPAGQVQRLDAGGGRLEQRR